MNLYDVYSLYDITPVRGAGSKVYDGRGREYLDFYGGHAVISIGHAHKHYVDKITSQVGKLGFYSNSVVNPLQQELADKLEELSGVEGYDLFLINSGAEANDNALKLASFYNKRKQVLALSNSFHGRTSAAINVTHTGRKHQAPINKGIRAIYHDITNIESLIEEIQKEKSAAVIIEAIQGVGGLDQMDPEGLKAIRTACDETDTILILDEVQAGYGRSGDFFAFQNSGIQPDIITTAKGMGNGFPIGGVLINGTKIPAVKSQLGTTYGGNHLACAAGIAVLDVLKDEDLMTNATEKGTYLQQSLAIMKGVKNVKGRGLMLGMEFDFPVAELRKSLVFDFQLFTGSAANKNLLRLLPPLMISQEDCDTFLDKLEAGLKRV
ncbi:MAG: acetylornithine/N-succinyldiaminopimelate aminotransferase [Saprospiraceae bacterium]|jgi:acetylornithine/N-succinyldiaminopimelate aminotransferase